MPARVVVGTQWGDEAKAKVVDFLAENIEVVSRYNGGANAGHTVKVEEDQFIFHLIPSGVFRRNVVMNVMGQGMVVDIETLYKEIATAEKMTNKYDLDIIGRLLLSGCAHVVFQYHKAIEAARKKRAVNEGTTMRGIAPTYSYKHAYMGVTVYDLFDEARLRQRLEAILPEINGLLKFFDPSHQPFTPDQVYTSVAPYLSIIKPIVNNAGAYLREAIENGQEVLFEGAQGTLLDIDHGSYPFVSSSNGTSGGIATGTGVPPNLLDIIIGVFKAYVTRVGSGPMVTRMNPSDEKWVREKGREFGATTGRPRNCGWFDFLIAKYAKDVNGLTHAAITKLDVLDGYKKVLVCPAYKYKGERLTTFPDDKEKLADCEPVLEEMPGWDNTKNCRDWDDLHPNAKAYVERIEGEIGIPVVLISTGPERNQMIVKGDI